MFQNFHAPSFGLGAIAGSAITVGVGYFFWPDQKKTKYLIADLASENKRIVNDANSLIRKIESEAAVSAQETKLR